MSAPLRPSYESELDARIAELEAALAPFACPVAPGLLDEQYITGEFHVRDFRRAAAAIQGRPAPLSTDIYGWNQAYARIAELEAALEDKWNEGFTEGYNEAFERYGQSAARIAELEAALDRLRQEYAALRGSASHD